MNDMDKELKEALAQNGNFDPAKAAALKKGAVADFRAKLRNVERITWIYLAICVAVAVFAIASFERAPRTDAKQLLLYGIVFLVAFESTILIKLWYWIANTKVSLLKDVKLLRMERAGQSTPASEGVPEGKRPGLSRWERSVWLVVLIASALATRTLASHGVTFEADTLNRTFVTLAPDGSGTAVASIRYYNESPMPETTISFNVRATSEVQWLDENGRPLSAESVTNDGRKQYTVALPKPLFPGEWLTYTRIIRNPAMAQEQGKGLWTYQADQQCGGRTNDFACMLLMPKASEFVSIQTEGAMEHVFRKGPKLFADGRREANEPFRFTVEYRIPVKPPAERDAK